MPAIAGELISGRDDARAKRKSLIKQVEKLIETVEGQVKRVDKLKSSAAQRPRTSGAVALHLSLIQV